MHIFLTGNIQIGKTTIINKYLLRSGKSADGFRTFWEPAGRGAERLFLAPFSSPPFGERHSIARRFAGDLVKVGNISEIFDTEGTKILKGSGKKDILVMDELGTLESGALVFQEEVLRRIAGDVPILGVIKPAETDFLNAVRASDNIKLYEVTAENRNAILAELLGKK